jgi:hypothetical protein
VRYVIALFDAPIPARSALGALETAGFPSLDVRVIPALADGPPPSEDAPLSGAAQPEEVRAALADWGVPAGDASAYAEGLRRGGFLVIVRCPTASACAAAGALNAVGAIDLEEQRATWRARAAPKAVTRGSPLDTRPAPPRR